MTVSELAARISRWTTRGILTAMILLAGLVVGKQTLVWWHVEPQMPGNVGPTSLAGGLGDPRQPHLFEFGDAAWQLRRASVRGNEAAAGSALLAAAAGTIRSAPVPAEEPPAEEKSLLDTLAAEKPLAEEPGRWQIYRIDGPFPIVVGVAAAKRSPLRSGPTVAPGARRVVIWGVAPPATDGTWSVYTFWPAGRSSSPAAGPVEIPVPPGSSRVMSVAAEGGGTMITFCGSGPIGDWTGFYDGLFAAKGWHHETGWPQGEQTWSAHYASPPGGKSATVDIQLRRDGEHCEGILISGGG